MASTTSSTATLCHWVCSTAYGDLPVEVRQETVTLLYDQVGVCSQRYPAVMPAGGGVGASAESSGPVQHCRASGADLGHAGGSGQRHHRARR